MAVFKLDPPPETNDVNVLRNYVNDLYDVINFVVYNIDSDNMTEDFLNSIGSSGSDG